MPVAIADRSAASSCDAGSHGTNSGEMRVRFDDARARAILEPRGITAAPLRSYFDRLMDYAQAARWGRREVARTRARSLVAP